MKAIGSYRAVLLATAITLAIGGLAESQVVLEENPPVTAIEPTADVTQAAGIVVYINPVTGAILPGPAPGSISLPLTSEFREALSTSAAGLEQAPLPGGGVVVDLQGRFQSPLIATIDANGVITTQHLEELPPGADPH